MNLYDTSALYGQNMSDEQQNKFEKFYSKVFSEYDITSIHDCSIGAGGTTIPLAKLGYHISGSDISENLLKKAEVNFKQEGFNVELYLSDFRNLSEVLPSTYDCIISTGNSLPHISNQDISCFVKSISSKVNENGLLYIDIRNWDKLLHGKPIFNARDPFVMTNEKHVSLYQIWNWHDNHTVDFIFVTSTDENGKHKKTSFTYAPTYFPLEYDVYEQILNENGFEIKQCFDVDDLWLKSDKGATKTGNFTEDFNQIGWYAVLAQKTKVT